ncbi:hypothetical protein [Thermomonospora umbrina]|nr:hypothetical protein [Thermomonospora umbrina]
MATHSDPFGHTRRPTDPPRLFTWDVQAPGNAPQSCGVTSDRSTAIAHVRDTLTAAPTGAQGTVRRVTISSSGHIAYLDLGLVAHAEQTGNGVSWVSRETHDR